MTHVRIVYRSIPAAVEAVDGEALYLPTPILGRSHLNRNAGSISITAAGQHLDAAGEVADRGGTYDFLFWNVHETGGAEVGDYSTDDLNLRFDAVPTPAAVVATAWYAERAPGPPGPARVVTYGFHRDVNRFFRATPIAKVTPGAAWKAGSRFVDNDQAAVDIDATDQVTFREQHRVFWDAYDGAGFESWQFRRSTHVGDVLHAERGASGIAIATYRSESAFHHYDAMPEWMRERMRNRLIDVIRIVTGPVIGDIPRPGPVEGPEAVTAARPTSGLVPLDLGHELASLLGGLLRRAPRR